MAIDETHGLREGQAGHCNKCASSITIRLMTPGDTSLGNRADLEQRAWLCRQCGLCVCGPCLFTMGVPTPKCSKCGGRMTLPLAAKGYSFCPQDYNEALLSNILDSGTILRPQVDSVMRALGPAGTTVFATTIHDRPALLVAAEPRYCYWPDDIASVSVLVEADEPTPLLTLGWAGTGGSYSFVITPGVNGITGQALSRFLNALVSSPRVDVFFEGDKAAFSRNVPVARPKVRAPKSTHTISPAARPEATPLPQRPWWRLW